MAFFKKKPKLIDDIPLGVAWVTKNLNASGYRADGTIESLKEVDRFINDEHRPGGVLDGKMGSIVFGLGCYIGQVIIDAVGGHWVTDDNDPRGELTIAVDLSDGSTIWPVMRVVKRIKEGPENAIYPYALGVTRGTQ